MPGIRRVGAGRQAAQNRPNKPAPAAASLKYTCCNDPQVEDDGEGHLVCGQCFTQISESNIVADVTFQEDSRGAATVQGGFISENARHARTLGAAAFRRVGGGERNSMQETEANGRRALASLCPRLGIPENVSNQATQLFMLAAQHNFSAGRKTDEVAAACLYAACRRQKQNQTLLIDIAELLRINVFRLGDVYKTLCKDLYLDDGKGVVGPQPLIDVEYLIMKYCTKLEFGDKARIVANDAAKIVRRMKRDWIVTGRHPAGLCASCIILAARMNNFRRTTRELVYVAKISSMTIGKRVHEFKLTNSAALTVDQFREYGFRYGKTHDPPAIAASALQKEKFEQKKRKRQEASMSRDASESGIAGNTPSRDDSTASMTPTQDEDDERRKRQRTDTEENDTPAPPQDGPRYDADGFAIPALPAAITQQGQPEKRKRGRPKKVAPEPIVISEEDLEEENALEAEINQVLKDDDLNMSRNEVQQAKDEENARRIAEEQKEIAAQKTKDRRQAEGITWFDGKVSTDREEVTAEDLEAEFADDPEVMNCELSAAEKIMKEQIWVLHNEDWLRQQQEKQMMEEVIKAAGTAPRGRKTKITKRKKKGKLGDGTGDAASPIETPADANMAMLAKRAPAAFSKHINYEALARAYQISPATSTTASRAPSEADTSRARSLSIASSVGPVKRRQSSPTPPTQHVTFAPAASTDAGRRSAQDPQAQQDEAPAAGENDAEDLESNPDDYNASEVGDGGDQDWDMGSDREDIGEDDYERTLDPFSRANLNNEIDDGYEDY